MSYRIESHSSARRLHDLTLYKFLRLLISSHSNNFKPENRRVYEYKISKEKEV
ncbi:MAG: hypothetical protein PWQ60_452 [Thermoanaerobacteraceae bacterium]|nr:hypothetical protein [Thermoanaerobacteraceae bacterium]